MAWHAIDALDDSFAATKRLLLPFSLRRWVVLAIVAFFVSGATGFNTNANVSGWNVTLPPDPAVPQPIDEGVVREPIAALVQPAQIGAPPRLALAALIAGLVVLLVVVLWYVAAVLEFVFVDIAKSQEVRIRGFFGASTGKGLSLFVFRLAVGLLVVSGVLLLGAIALLSELAFLVVVLLLSPVFLLLAVGLWVLLRFTTDFVVPVMIADDVGVLAGWQAFWPALRADWKQYGLYGVVRFLLGLLASVVAGIGFTAVALLLAVPFVILGLLAYLLLVAGLGAPSPLTEIVIAGFVILFALTLVVVGTVLIQVPVQTYLRYYGLFVLGAVSPEYDLVEEIRTGIEDDRTAQDDVENGTA